MGALDKVERTPARKRGSLREWWRLWSLWSLHASQDHLKSYRYLSH
jgi:hypothetical protein